MSAISRESSAAILGRVQTLLPQIAAAADQIERDRRLPHDLVAALTEAGLFRLLLPRAFGGAEVDPLTFALAIEAVARADGSTAWCLGQASGCSMIAAHLEPAGAHAIFDDSGTILAWGQSPDARAVATAGGYRVSGRWAFLSGCHHATWFGGLCTVYAADGTPRYRDDGTPETRTMLFRPHDAEIVDVWHVSGLRGTGSDTIAVADLFVPQEHSARVDPAQRRERGSLYVYPLTNIYAAAIASVALGLARGALDAYVALATAKTPRGTSNVLRDSAVVQAQVGQAEARLRAARTLLHTTLAEVWEIVSQTETLALPRRVSSRLAASYAMEQAAEVVDTAYHAAGSTAIFASGAFERRFRDVHAVTQQIHGRAAHYEAAGRVLLGLDPRSTFI
jgi:alkylation response protein AidB-like acyl-CoA dehydrogenase